MKKYNIEGGIDFYYELYKSLDEEENNNKTEEDNKLCLITNQLLTDKFVTMRCGHKFNYIPLYKDLVNHKQKFNRMEGSSSQLKITEIRCPYCRKKQNEVLPYYEELNLEKVNGVNYINPNSSTSYEHAIYSPPHKCDFLIPNPNYDENKPNSIEISEYSYTNCKFISCFHSGTQIKKYNPNIDDYGDTKNYCWSHKKQIIKKYKTEKAIKKKEDIKQFKLLFKESEKKAKEEKKLQEKKKKEEKKLEEMNEKQKIKDELKKLVMETKLNKKNKIVDLIVNVNETNIILESNIIIQNTNNNNEEPNNTMSNANKGCIEILKTGAKKGSTCGCKIFNNNYCKRHLKIII